MNIQLTEDPLSSVLQFFDHANAGKSFLIGRQNQLPMDAIIDRPERLLVDAAGLLA